MGEPRFNGLARLTAGVGILAVLLLAGCRGTPTRPQAAIAREHKTYELTTLPGEQAIALLSWLDLGDMSLWPDGSGFDVVGSPDRLARISTILDVVDQEEEYMVEPLVPASKIEAIPSNDEIAKALGSIAIGTFANPPPCDAPTRSIIDVHDDAVVVIMPARFREDLLILGRLGIDNFRRRPPDVTSRSGTDASPSDKVRSGPAARISAEGSKPASPLQAMGATAIPSLLERPQSVPVVSQPRSTGINGPHDRQLTSFQDSDAVSLARRSSDLADMTLRPPTSAGASDIETDQQLPKTARSQAETGAPQPACGPPALPNGDDTLEMDLPDRIQLIHLLDLVAEYLHLDYVYEPSQVKDDEVTLKLHGKLEGRIQVRDLYPLLESILKFKGLAMTRHEGNLVTIVPIRDALEVDPPIVDGNYRALEPGNMVVTRVFRLQHIDASSAANLLENMRLGVATVPISETGLIIVTCYAHRTTRIEQLLDLADKPGRARQFRLRQLRYTMASHVIRKVSELARELQNVPVTVIPSRVTSAPSPSGVPMPPPPGQRADQSADARTATPPPVYLDADERQNRVLMIGDEEQLAVVEELLAALDVQHAGIQTTRLYGIKCVDASEVKSKLEELHFARSSPSGLSVQPAMSPGAQSRSRPDRTANDLLVDEPQIILLEATNALLIAATAEQHAEIDPIIRHIDVTPEDRRILRSYAIKYVDATEVESHLPDFGMTGNVASTEKIQTVASGSVPATPWAGLRRSAQFSARQPQVSVIKVTNSLLIKATSEQHEQIKSIIDYVDVQPSRETLPYEIYSLENQDPETLAEVLDKLVRETITNPEDKTEKVIARTEDPVTIIPDKNTFSVIVHTSRKNQIWIGDLIERLDVRRPQVLIDVTLVEIAKSEAFAYDLNLITSHPDLTATSGLTGVLRPGADPVTSSDIIDRLAASNRDHFLEFQSAGGTLSAFYGDRHIQLLLEAMQSKDYGRILAKPKILVNDNEPGMIKTADTTYVVKRSSVPVSTGGAGTDATLIETAIDYEPYEAGIELNITPHISQGDLLRLDITLTRSDFRETQDSEKPPNTTSSELKTTAFIPDGSTIILGGLLRLNQSKGVTKVPILGDIPLIGGLFRSSSGLDTQSKLYIFVKAEIIRPSGPMSQGMDGLEAISDKNRTAFEEHEQAFQKHQIWPGVEPRPTSPRKVLEAR